MARTRTRQEIRDQARTYADAVESQNTTDAQANVWIDASVAQLWGKLTTRDPQRYMTTTTLTTSAAVLSYDFTDAAVFDPVASDFMSIVGVDWMGSGGRYPLDPFAFNDRAVDSLLSPDVSRYGTPGTRYAVRGQGLDGSEARLVFDRSPNSGTYEVHYIRAPGLLVSESATFDGVAGFDEWIVLRVAILMCAREETDPSALMMLKAEVEKQIDSLGPRRDTGRAPVPAKVWNQDRGRRGMFPRR